MLRIDQPSTIGMGIVAFVTADSQSSSDHRQIGYQWLADQSTDRPITMKRLKSCRRRNELWRSEVVAGIRWPPNHRHQYPVDGEGMTSAIRTITATSVPGR
jgi:hypothetical protein